MSKNVCRGSGMKAQTSSILVYAFPLPTFFRPRHQPRALRIVDAQLWDMRSRAFSVWVAVQSANG